MSNPPRRAAPKLSTSRWSDNHAVMATKAALMTIRNNPRVNTISGSDSRRRIGPTKALMTDQSNAIHSSQPNPPKEGVKNHQEQRDPQQPAEPAVDVDARHEPCHQPDDGR